MKNYEPFTIPENNKEHLQIGNLDFDYLEDQCKARTYFTLNLTLAAKTTQFKDGQKQQLLEEGSNLEEGAVEFQLSLENICQQGVPTGVLIFTDGSTGDPHHMYFQNYGIHRNLGFYGQVTLKDGWIGIDGVFKPRDKESPCWPIKAAKKIPYEQLVWTQYKFSLEETDGMSPELVTAVYVNDFEGTEFPERVFQFNDLTHLWLRGRRGKNVAGVTQLSDAIGELHKLSNFFLSATNIKYLPLSLFKLPNLESLSLESNQLLNIPNDIDLPKLRNVNVSHNQLTTLPESLALQPNLKSLSLYGNPWQSLPDAFTKIADISMTAEDKLKFLSKDYVGADGSVNTEWDKEMYFVRNDTELLAVMHNTIKGTPFEKYQTTFNETALKAVCINPNVPDNYSNVGNTRFGGLPDLPIGVDYPTIEGPYMNKGFETMSFFAQLNCEELAPYQNYLPRTGMLYFFTENEEEYDNVVWYHPKNDGLLTALLLKDMDFNNAYTDEPYKPYRAEIRKLAALPMEFGDKPFYEHEEQAFKTEESKAAFHESLGRKGVLREHNNYYYTDMNHSINDSIETTSGESPNAQAASKHGGNPEDWTILLRLYSHYESGFQFSDAGELYFMIHKGDLAKQDFSKVFSFIDSS